MDYDNETEYVHQIFCDLYMYEFPNSEASKFEKDWHDFIGDQTRSHMACRILVQIFPRPIFRATCDPRIKDLFRFVRHVEKQIFEMADDLEDYFHLIDEKICEIRENLHRYASLKKLKEELKIDIP
ncbi:hypothetical protein WR25_02376 [Diploscapter pachys]|uniref:KIX domain-containing protein n=1 Tax=Diploscapter pachys TaxID=2018661 RepID=A0A2A2LLX6_9BILA|nr:hypothetical protein WR25_02376 [Diploscapter pachys]